jgi:prepilin-type N-terminal cleavage/methylation domain-containing protein
VNRRGFTLLETMMATAIASVVVLACMMFMYAMNRTDASMEVRAQQRSSLGRIRTVMHRTFTSLLMSDESRPTGGELDNLVGGQLNQRISTGPRPTPTATPVAPEAAGDKGAADTKGSTDQPGAPGEPEAPTRKQPKPPPVPRIILGVDSSKTGYFDYQAAPDAPIEPVSPQRLEVVLHRSPIPEATIDVMDMPLPTRSQRRREEQRRSEAEEQESGAATSATSTARALTPGSDEEELEESALPVRAVRGAFELFPQPPRGYRPPGLPAAPVSMDGSFESTGLWELWWIPLRPPGLDAETMTGNEYLFSGLARPYFIAGDLKYARWTVFIANSKRPDLLSTWSGDLPAYVELRVETSAGLKSNWMFEVDWAVGPEVARKPEDQNTARRATSTDQNADGGTAANKADSPIMRSGGARPLPSPTRPSSGEKRTDRKGGGK